MRVSAIVQRFLVPFEWLRWPEDTVITTSAGHGSAHRLPPQPGRRRDLRRDNRGSQPRWANWPRGSLPDNLHAACPAGMQDREHEGDLDQHMRTGERAGRSTAADMRASPQVSRDVTNRTPEG